MIHISAVMKFKCCVGDSFGGEKGASCGAGDGREIRRWLVRDLIKGACVGVPE